MTYPQPSSTAAVIGGQNIFRLRTPLYGAGDMYESEVGSLAMAVGPDSDVSSVMVHYLNQNDTQSFGGALIGELLLSTDRVFVGGIAANMVQQYPGLQVTGRILFSVADLYDATWLPAGYVLANDVVLKEQPLLDVIQYFEAAPSLSPQRSDKIYDYQYFTAPAPGGAGKSAWVVVPAWGRKSGFFNFVNLHATEAVTTTIYGVKYSSSASPAATGALQVSLATAVVAALGGTLLYDYNSSADGSWDAFAVKLDNYRNGTAMPTRIVLSDDVR